MILAKDGRVKRHAIVTDAHVDALHGKRVQEALEKADLRVDRIAITAGEATKGMESVMEVAGKLTDLGADRSSSLIALGGGVVGDLAGFVASIYMRGIPVIQVPTTLLAQVDSSVGGKTGVDTEAGKNLLGSFHQPAGVFIDCAFLGTLPEEQIRSGLAEVIKYGVIEDPALLDEIEAAAGAGRLRDPAFLARIVEASCRIKKGFVEIDERDRGVRRMLNFGHTVGHAVEAASGYSLSHGEAVAIGMAAAARISERMRHLPAGDVRRIESVIRAVGLPDRLPGNLDPEEILSRMAFDKKKEGDAIHFVLLRKPGLPFVNGAIPGRIVRETLEGMKK
jgi:3-dehydroquinate synthase